MVEAKLGCNESLSKRKLTSFFLQKKEIFPYSRGNISFHLIEHY